MGYIYMIVNDVNNKKYIGQTTRSIQERWSAHKQDSKVKDTHLYRAIQKYGVEHFSIHQIEECPDEELDELERFYIAYYHTFEDGYNSTLGGQGYGTRGNKNLQKEPLQKLWSQGLGVLEISQILGLSKRTVSKWIRFYNIASDKEILTRGEEKARRNHSTQSVIFQEQRFHSISELAEYLHNTILSDRKTKNIIQGISYALKNNKEYLGLSFQRG